MFMFMQNRQFLIKGPLFWVIDPDQQVDIYVASTGLHRWLVFEHRIHPDAQVKVLITEFFWHLMNKKQGTVSSH